MQKRHAATINFAKEIGQGYASIRHHQALVIAAERGNVPRREIQIHQRFFMHDIEAFILAGGASRRMGTDKSQLVLGDVPLIQRIKNTLASVAKRVAVVGSRDKDDPNVVPDVYPHWGALGGIHGALTTCNSEWAIVVACDLPFVTSELVTQLINLQNRHEAVVPIQPDDRPQPLCALYRVDPCLQRAVELIEAGRRRPLDLLEVVRTRWVAFSELAHLEHSANFFVNINTPEDYYEATQKASAHKDLS
jgi:molybdopterin-guanine dinucleotide biosynthesis protein A